MCQAIIYNVAADESVGGNAPKAFPLEALTARLAAFFLSVRRIIMKTKEELEKYRIRMPERLAALMAASEGVDATLHEEEDEYGFYSTGLFRYKGKDVLITLDDGKWHLSANTNHPIGYYELKELRYEFCPNRLSMAQIFPPREEFVNVAENCYHLYELSII